LIKPLHRLKTARSQAKISTRGFIEAFAPHLVCQRSTLRQAVERGDTDWLPHYEDQYGALTDSVRADLLKMSAAPGVVCPSPCALST